MGDPKINLHLQMLQGQSLLVLGVITPLDGRKEMGFTGFFSPQLFHPIYKTSRGPNHCV